MTAGEVDGERSRVHFPFEISREHAPSNAAPDGDVFPVLVPDRRGTEAAKRCGRDDRWRSDDNRQNRHAAQYSAASSLDSRHAVSQLKIKLGLAGKSQMQMVAKKHNFADLLPYSPAAFFAQHTVADVRVLASNGTAWQFALPAPASVNDAVKGKFSDKSP